MALIYNKEIENTYTSPDGLFTIDFGEEKEEDQIDEIETEEEKQ